jgi:hypothetical protein
VTAVLVVNAGSSSLKLRVLSGDGSLAGSVDLPAPRGEADADSVKEALGGFADVGAVGHRIVHGGTIYNGPVLTDAGVRQRLGALSDLAPLHQPTHGGARGDPRRRDQAAPDRLRPCPGGLLLPGLRSADPRRTAHRNCRRHPAAGVYRAAEGPGYTGMSSTWTPAT